MFFQLLKARFAFFTLLCKEAVRKLNKQLVKEGKFPSPSAINIPVSFYWDVFTTVMSKLFSKAEFKALPYSVLYSQLASGLAVFAFLEPEYINNILLSIGALLFIAGALFNDQLLMLSDKYPQVQVIADNWQLLSIMLLVLAQSGILLSLRKNLFSNIVFLLTLFFVMYYVYNLIEQPGHPGSGLVDVVFNRDPKPKSSGENLIGLTLALLLSLIKHIIASIPFDLLDDILKAIFKNAVSAFLFIGFMIWGLKWVLSPVYSALQFICTKVLTGVKGIVNVIHNYIMLPSYNYVLMPAYSYVLLPTYQFGHMLCSVIYTVCTSPFVVGVFTGVYKTGGFLVTGWLILAGSDAVSIDGAQTPVNPLPLTEAVGPSNEGGNPNQRDGAASSAPALNPAAAAVETLADSRPEALPDTQPTREFKPEQTPELIHNAEAGLEVNSTFTFGPKHSPTSLEGHCSVALRGVLRPDSPLAPAVLERNDVLLEQLVTKDPQPSTSSRRQSLTDTILLEAQLPVTKLAERFTAPGLGADKSGSVVPGAMLIKGSEADTSLHTDGDCEITPFNLPEVQQAGTLIGPQVQQTVTSMINYFKKLTPK